MEQADILTSSCDIPSWGGITYSAKRDACLHLSLHNAASWTQEARGEHRATGKYNFTLKLWVYFCGIEGSHGMCEAHLLLWCHGLFAASCCHCIMIYLSSTGREASTNHFMPTIYYSILQVCTWAASCSYALAIC